MSYSFTKLAASITDSSVWCEDDKTVRVWICMLSMADYQGRVWAAVPGLAHRARVSVQATKAALAKFMAPDKFSRCKDWDGRRIEEIDGGWLLLNHARYRAMRDPAVRREQTRKAVERYRKRKKSTVSHGKPAKPQKAHTEAEAEAEAEYRGESPPENCNNRSLSQKSGAELVIRDRELARCQEEVKRIKENAASDAWGVQYTDQEKQRLAELKARIVELKAYLGVKA